MFLGKINQNLQFKIIFLNFYVEKLRFFPGEKKKKLLNNLQFSGKNQQFYALLFEFCFQEVKRVLLAATTFVFLFPLRIVVMNIKNHPDNPARVCSSL
jgi:hypothetical protein